jgi:hypothetical protein
MKERELQIIIAPNGEVNLHIHGYKGPSCLEVIKQFEQIVGRVKSYEKSSAFYEPEEDVRFRIDQQHQ